MTDTQQTLATIFPDLNLEFDYPLAPLTYFKVGGPAEVFVAIKNKEALRNLIAVCREESIPYTMLGGASNVVVADEGVQGVVIRYIAEEITTVNETETTKTIHVDTGIRTAILVSQTIQLGLTGLEYFLGVPGTLGGAVYNNSHYLDDLIGEHITEVEVITPENTFRWLSHEECQFGYDSSRFHTTDEIIVTAAFELQKGNQAASQARIKEATQYRAQTQPLGPPSSGCIFQNVPNNDRLRTLFPQFAKKSHVPGGFLIDQAGLKGTRVGDVVVSEKHAAWFINEGNGTAKDVRALIEKVKASVKEQFGITLHEEVFYLK